MRKIFLFLMLGMFLISIASAENIGSFNRGQKVEMFQTCNNCTYCNMTRLIDLSTSNIILSNIIMDRDGTYYNYTIAGDVSSGMKIGEYKYCYDCGNGYTSDTGCNSFTLKDESMSESNLQNIILIIAVLIFGLFVWRFMTKFLGSMIVFVVGLGLLFTIPSLGWIAWIIIIVGLLMFVDIALGGKKRRRRRRY